MADASNDFAALTRQYLDLWGQALRGAAPQPGLDPGQFGLGDMFEAWRRQAGGQGGFSAAMEHFNRQSSDWYAQMQQVAARFAGRDHSAGDVAAALGDPDSRIWVDVEDAPGATLTRRMRPDSPRSTH